MANHSRTRVDRSAAALGLGYKQWTRNDLRLILGHYGVRFAAGDDSRSLIRSLNRLAAQRGLTRQDRLDIINAHKAGIPLPSRKPIVRVPANSSSSTPPVVAPSATITQPDDCSSAASNDSDTDMSDSEDIEELPSLSEEERDLREYTATMSLRPAPRTRARTLPVNRSVVGTQRAAFNQAPTIPRSTSVAVTRAGTTNNSMSNHPARPHANKAVPTLESKSGPSPPRSTRAMSHECLICYDAFDPVKSLVRQPTSSCEHEINICRSCLAASISSQSETRPWTRIRCPAFTCEAPLTYEDIQEFAEPQVFAR